MGAILKATCRCGYSAEAYTASGRRDHGKVFEFPHLCADCAEVVSADLLAERVQCPKCGGSAITRYGVAIKEIPFGWWPRLLAHITGAQRRRDLQMARLKATLVDNSYCYRHNTTYGINGDPSMCPKCGQQDLLFYLTGLFD